MPTGSRQPAAASASYFEQSRTVAFTLPVARRTAAQQQQLRQCTPDDRMMDDLRMITIT